MTLLGLFAVGIAVAEYPSGVFADWAGRGRALVVGSLLYAAGVVLLLIPGPIVLLAASQLVLGVASAFRSGADTALLYSHLAQHGESDRYPACLVKMRLAALIGLAAANAIGGVLYSWRPESVFLLSSGAILISIVPLIGLDERRSDPVDHHYWSIVRRGALELRRNRAAQILIVLGGVGATYFIFAYWAVQSYLVSFDTSPVVLGQMLALVALLQSAAISASAWIAGRSARQTRAFTSLLVGLALAFAGVAGATWAGLPGLGGGLLVAAAACSPLFRNLVNIRLQPLLPDRVRASMVSLETWVGALCYAAVFPLAGWLLDTAGVAVGHAWIALLVGVTTAPLLLIARARQI